MSRALRLTTWAQRGSSLISSSRLDVGAASSVAAGGLPDPLLLIPQNQSRHWRSKPGAGGWTSGRNREYRVSYKAVGFPGCSGHSPGRALPSIPTVCSWHPFCTGGGAGPSSSAASRSSRSSLLCRRLKTRRWSWEVREKGAGGSSALHRRFTLPSPVSLLLACTLGWARLTQIPLSRIALPSC